MSAGAIEAIAATKPMLERAIKDEIAKRDASIAALEKLTAQLEAADYLLRCYAKEGEERRVAGLCAGCGKRRSPGSARYCRACYQERATIRRSIRAHNAHSDANER